MKVIQVISSNLPIGKTAERKYGAVELLMEEYRKKLEEYGIPTEFKWLNDVKCDKDTIVHIHVSNLCLEAKKRGIPYIYSNHDHHSFYYGKNSSVFREQLEAINGSVFSICHAESVMNYFSETDKLFYLPHGVDTNYYTPTKYPVTEKKLLMVAANGIGGNYGEDRKGFRLGIEAAKKLNLPITIVGNEANSKFFEIHTDLADYEKITIDSSNCTEQRKLEYYQSHSIFLHPSSLEYGSPNITLLESWACGLPIVGSYDGSRHIEGLQILKALNVDEICSKIEYVYDNYETIRNKMLVNKEEHDWSTIVGYLKKMYEAYQVIGIQNTSEEVKTKYLNVYNR
jgi:glycosyltransferase involved in cell wall biosynthesis